MFGPSGIKEGIKFCHLATLTLVMAASPVTVVSSISVGGVGGSWLSLMYFPLGFTASEGGLSPPSLSEVAVALGPSPATNGVLRLNVEKFWMNETETMTIYDRVVDFSPPMGC